jgi:hypothetical protein
VPPIAVEIVICSKNCKNAHFSKSEIKDSSANVIAHKDDACAKIWGLLPG